MSAGAALRVGGFAMDFATSLLALLPPLVLVRTILPGWLGRRAAAIDERRTEEGHRVAPDTTGRLPAACSRRSTHVLPPDSRSPFGELSGAGARGARPLSSQTTDPNADRRTRFGWLCGFSDLHLSTGRLEVAIRRVGQNASQSHQCGRKNQQKQ